MLRSLAVSILATMTTFSAAVAAQAPAPPKAATAKVPEKLQYVEGGMLVLLAPSYPKDPLARGETAVVTVTGTIQTDGRLENVRVESSVPGEAFTTAVREAAQLWRMQPRIDAPGCGATETEGQVSFWFEIDNGKPKVSYGVRPPPAGAAAPQIYNDRAPIRTITPEYPAKLAADPKMPRSVMQIAYVGVAASGDVINVTLAPMLYYREFEPLIALAIRQWKYAPQDEPWCGETVFHMSLE
jgi:TonB family protein